MPDIDDDESFVSAFTCPVCGRTSYHPMDVKYEYCGHCHEFTGHVLGRLLMEERRRQFPPTDERKVAANLGTLWNGEPIVLVLCRMHLYVLTGRMGEPPFTFTPYEGDEPCEVCAGGDDE